MAITNAIIKAGSQALTKGTEKAIKKAATEVATKAAKNVAAQALTKGLTGAGISSMAPKAGSTLDGILGPSSGLRLPEPKVTPTTLAEYTGGEASSIGDIINKMDMPLSEIQKDVALPKKTYDLIRNQAQEAASINDSALDALGVGTKTDLPTLNRDQYYEDTLGKVGQNGVRYADVPDYMNSHLSNNQLGTARNDEILRDLFQDETSSLSDLYERYGELAQGVNANEIYTPQNIDDGLSLLGDKKYNEVTQDFADRMFGDKRNIDVTKSTSGTKNLKVSRPEAEAIVEEAAAPAESVNPMLAEEIAQMKEDIAAAGGAGMGTGVPTAAAGGVGPEGFNVKLKTGATTNVKVGPSAAGSTKQQRAVRKLDDMTAKSMNTNAKQYKAVVGKSGSIDNGYKSVAERIRAEKIDQANVADKAKAALAGREDIKQQGLKYAEESGVTMDLSGIDNTIGLSSVQKRKLAELGLSLDDMLGGKSAVTPTQAEDIYKTLRDYAWKWEDSTDPATTMLSKAMKEEANAVRDIIDNTMDSINVDYKTPLVEFMAENGEDPAYIRKIAGKTDFKFSDLRKDQSDWITIEDLAGNKIKEEPTLNVFGIDTGAQNPFTSGAEKLKEKIYERQAYGRGGAGGSTGAGGVPPTGGAAAENTINVETAGGAGSTLSGLLGKAKTAGLVGAGVIGGAMLGGGGSDGGSSDLASLYSPMATGTTTTQPQTDVESTMTIGGYSYDQLEQGYMAALQAGDTAAAKLIANLIGMLDDKLNRYYTAQKNKTSSTSTTASKQKAALNVLSGLMSNYEAQGPIGGRFTQFMNTITGGGYNPKTAAYDTGAQGSLGTIIKALGDTGALSEGDQKRALELLPKTTDSAEAAKAKYQQLIQILQGAGAL
ncbi:MAG: hypothetical protein IIZ78_00620 [Clostridiales bacterium]|nr:hypothetical protein [Clostridiales bacterium]